MNAAGSLFEWILRFVLLYFLFILFFVIGSLAVADVMPATAPSEPGPVPATSGLLIIALANLPVTAALILSSRWGGWKLAVILALSYYGTVTFLMQIETWYFLSSITVGPQLLLRLFLMGIPTAFLFIPLATWILGKGRNSTMFSAPSFGCCARCQYFAVPRLKPRGRRYWLDCFSVRRRTLGMSSPIRSYLLPVSD